MIKMNEPKVLTRMRLSCCWGDNLNEKELNEVVDYINHLQNNWNELKKWLVQLQKLKGINQQGFSWGVAQEVLDKMQELEKKQ